MSNLKRGRAKIEFYQHIKEIREAYNQGFVVYKALYEKMSIDLQLKMGYDAFLKYAKIEFEPETQKNRSRKKSTQDTNLDKSIEKEIIKPVKNTHTSEENKTDKDTQESMEEYLKNIAPILNAKKRR